MANTTGDTGAAGAITSGEALLDLSLQDLAVAIREVGKDNGRSWVATVTDASMQGAYGIVYASLGTSEIQVVDWLTPLTAGQTIIVKKFDNTQASVYVLEEYAETPGDVTSVPYGLDFPAPMSSPNGRFRAHWAGTILSIETSGVATFGLTVGGSAVTVSSSIAAGDWVIVTATAGSDSDSAIEVTIG